MHIALVRTEFDAARGGAERYAVNLARAWVSLGHRVTVVCARHDEKDAAGMEVVSVSRPKILGPFKHAWFAARAGRAAAEVKAEATICLARAWPGDVLRLGDGLHRPWMAMRYPDLASRKRALLNPKHYQLLKLERELFLPGHFSRYIANSAMVKRQVVHMYGVEPDRIHVIPNGVDPVRFNLSARESAPEQRARHGIGPDDKVVLFSGMDFRRKGLLAAVRGFIQLQREFKAGPLWFICVGKGDESEAKAELQNAGLLDRAMFFAATQGIEKWYGAADLFVLPTMYDPSANAVTEALACGTPVLTSQENGARQHIVEGENGRTLHERESVEEFAQAALDFLRKPRDPAAVAGAGKISSTAENAAAVLDVLVQAQGERASLKRATGFAFSEEQKTQWRSAKGRAAKLRLLRGWLWASGADVSLHELARRLEV
ncbi:MAG: glycosyltransferase family 4 protein [Planctomycetes bacterium]|nr:glycosyltransferase family 4 protein [Planctomycetota bacterium]